MTAYTDWIIVVDGTQLVYAETLEAEGTILTTSLATYQLSETPEGTDLSLSVHIVSFSGPDSMVEVSEDWKFAIEAVSTCAEQSE